MLLKSTNYWNGTYDFQSRTDWLNKYATTARKKRLICAYFSYLSLPVFELNYPKFNIRKILETILSYIEGNISEVEFNEAKKDLNQIGLSITQTQYYFSNSAFYAIFNTLRLCSEDITNDTFFVGVINQSLCSMANTNLDYCNQLFGLFTPLNWQTSYHTTDTTQLAETMYQTQNWSLGPILADAMMDAGCEDEYILWLLRENYILFGRGIWLLDQLTGRK